MVQQDSKNGFKRYNPQDIEAKWRQKWAEEKQYKFSYEPAKEKFYTLVELPYPSGDLHIGHWFTFIAPDVLSRFKTMRGYNVFFPMGYDAFGLPAENAAIKRNVHPQDWTLKNIETMTAQFETMGTMIDWDHVTITCLPEYYRWNQWIFQKMYEKGIAYRGKTLSNWCPTDQTVLANEHVENGRCWRCGDIVVQKEVEQWFLKITEYADDLLWKEDGNGVDWPKSVMSAQNDWIGKSEGAKVKFQIKDTDDFVTVFTTRLDTIYGATFLVLAPEHPLVEKITTAEQKEAVVAYKQEANKKSELERKENKEKTGVFTGVYALNSVTGAEIPVWIADYVLAGYGTGAIMAVPAHDDRDGDFANKFGLPIKQVIEGEGELPILEYGTLINSATHTGLTSGEAKKRILEELEAKGLAEKEVIYHLRDWSVSRQRYWGTPVPMIDCPTDGIVPVPEKDLPVILPYDVDYQPKGKPPLASNEEWLQVKCPKCGGEAKRDAETLDTFFDSSWYYYRYIDPKFDKGPFDPAEVKKLMPVDIYFGGGEHTLGHTLYARFFTKFFKDLGMVDFSEFAKKRIQHGIVLGPDGNKMSKSKGNVINPDDVVKEFGTDAVRVYLSFMMPYQATGPWSTTAMYGTFRFLKRIWELQKHIVSGEPTSKDQYEMHRTIKKVTEDISENRLNTAVAAMMEWINFLEGKITKKEGVVTQEEYEIFLQLLSPFAPFMAEELWQTLRQNSNSYESIHKTSWPVWKKEFLVESAVTIVVQINGKLRDSLTMDVSGLTQEKVETAAKSLEKIEQWISGKDIKKIIYVPGKLINFVVV